MRTPLVLIALALVATPAAGADLYLELETASQGSIEGEALFQPEAGRIELQSFMHSTQQGIDPTTGLPDGREVVGPFVITKNYDRASLRMLAAQGAREQITRFVIRAYRPQLGGGGADEHYLTIEIEVAAFASRTIGAVDPGDDGQETYEIGFQRILWTDEIDGFVWEDVYGSGSSRENLTRSAQLSPIPNPTSGRTSFSFRLPETGHVSIDVFDLRGRRVAAVFDGPTLTTAASVEWDGTDGFGQPVAPGVYMVKMRAGEWLTTRKLSVVR